MNRLGSPPPPGSPPTTVHDHPVGPPPARRRRAIAAAAGGVVIALVVGLVAVLTGGSPVVSTTTGTPAPPAPNPAAMPAGGTVLWNTLTGSLSRVFGGSAWAVRLAGGTAVLAPGFGIGGFAADTVLGVDARTGAVRWRWRRNGWLLQGIDASAADGVAAALWITNPGRKQNQSVTVGESSPGGFSYAVTVFDLRSGRLHWALGGVGSGMCCGGVVIVKRAVVTLADSTAGAFAVAGGRRIWRRAAPPGCGWGVLPSLATGGEIALDDAAVFPYACYPNRGPVGAVNVEGGVSASGGIERLVPATGASIWQRRLPGAPLRLAQAAGTVAVTTYRGGDTTAVAQVFDAAAGRPRWHTQLYPPAGCCVDANGAPLLAVGQTGDVYLLAPVGRSPSARLERIDGADGRVRWTAAAAQAIDYATSVNVVGGQVVLGGVHDSIVGACHRRSGPGCETTQLRLFSATTGKQLAQQPTPQVTVLEGGLKEISHWDAAIAVEPGLAVMSTLIGHHQLGAFSLPRLPGA